MLSPITSSRSLSPTNKNAASAQHNTTERKFNSSKPQLFSINTDTIDVKAKNMLEVNVPGDWSCLFWAVALNYLLPVVDKDEQFRERFQKLFGTEHDADIHSVKGLLQKTLANQFATLHEQNDEPAPTLTKLVTKIFRNKVIDYIEQNRDQFKPFLENDEHWDVYLNRMKNLNGWGGNSEIAAMQLILNCRFNIVEVNVKNKRSKRESVAMPINTDIELDLVFINNNHYKFCINKDTIRRDSVNTETDLGEAIRKPIEDSISSPTIFSNSNAKNGQEIKRLSINISDKSVQATINLFDNRLPSAIKITDVEQAKII